MYKLIGPALVQQDALEARANVKKRLEFIGSELSRLDAQLKALEEKQARKHSQVARMRMDGPCGMLGWSEGPAACKARELGARRCQDHSLAMA